MQRKPNSPWVILNTGNYCTAVPVSYDLVYKLLLIYHIIAITTGQVSKADIIALIS